MNLLLISKVLQKVKGILVSTGLTFYFILAVSGHQTLSKICKTLTEEMTRQILTKLKLRCGLDYVCVFVLCMYFL